MTGSWVYVPSLHPGMTHKAVEYDSNFTVVRVRCACGAIYAGSVDDDLSKVMEQHKEEAEQ